MTWINRLRLLGGLIGVLLIVAVLTLIFNQRQTQAASRTGTVSADTYTIGAITNGTVSRQYVNAGETVQQGDELCRVQSPALRQEISEGLEINDSAAYDVDSTTGTLTYKATATGELTTMKCKVGTTLGGGQTFAEISAADSQFVVARFELTPRDYARVQQGARASLLLPDNATVGGTVSDIKVATDEYNRAQTEVRIESPALQSGELGDLAKPGTPVVATLELRDDGPLAGVSDLGLDFLQRIGLS
jgi:multidrug resistance efflux pump